ncbi:MAG: DUF3109 family protein [Bacteroidetes bacterium]|nr:DUF3109 family protein [Bacteroidota bacterium]MBK9415359.1 DUF3109 family protein [Bacteroidota bacterium]MBL0033225.1 DUF3109 family protein [Bacteroidota bacterium]MBP6428575.1 DUF3109 family protein [Bacteroidia bacterium]MBP6658807.1 DUF3109 family protein [Bacteroidia bacterium]
MLVIDNTLITDEVLEKHFVCDLNACKGACCVKGDYGAPLEDDELEQLDKVYDKVKPYMTPAGIEAVEKQGKYLLYEKKEWVTPLIKGKECAYTFFDEAGVAKCAIEKAYYEGKVKWKKPISCHLYPIRITKQRNGLEALNYDKWSICKAACKLGDSLKVPVYKFLKDSLTRKYGKEWYKQLEIAASRIDEVKAMKKTMK